MTVLGYGWLYEIDGVLAVGAPTTNVVKNGFKLLCNDSFILSTGNVFQISNAFGRLGNQFAEFS